MQSSNELPPMPCHVTMTALHIDYLCSKAKRRSLARRWWEEGRPGQFPSSGHLIIWWSAQAGISKISICLFTGTTRSYPTNRQAFWAWEKASGAAQGVRSTSGKSYSSSSSGVMTSLRLVMMVIKFYSHWDNLWCREGRRSSDGLVAQGIVAFQQRLYDKEKAEEVVDLHQVVHKMIRRTKRRIILTIMMMPRRCVRRRASLRSSSGRRRTWRPGRPSRPPTITGWWK